MLKYYIIAMSQTNSGILWFTCMETVAILIASSLQIYNIKKLLNNRRIV